MDTIGLIGVGLLGSAIAARLTSAGYSVLGYDIVGMRWDADRADNLVILEKALAAPV